MSDFYDWTFVNISLGAWSHFALYVSEMKKLEYILSHKEIPYFMCMKKTMIWIVDRDLCNGPFCLLAAIPEYSETPTSILCASNDILMGLKRSFYLTKAQRRKKFQNYLRHRSPALANSIHLNLTSNPSPFVNPQLHHLLNYSTPFTYSRVTLTGFRSSLCPFANKAASSATLAHIVLATKPYLRASKYTLLAIAWISGSRSRSAETEWRIASMI